MKDDMTLYEAIRTRRSIGRVKSDPVERDKIERILEAGNWAPSHMCTEPWRFYVMTGSGRQILADAYADIAAENASNLAKKEMEVLRSKQGAKAFRAPLVIAVVVSPSAAPGVIRIEEFAAAHSAVQNMLLTAHALGLGAIWRSGEPMYHPRMKRAFELQEGEELVGLLYIGYPDMTPPAANRRTSASNKTVWITE
ncbi:nitroreductase [Paenibacillus allorhizosphaerae]|uniref:Putative NAD(P)H nitroreductase n=1 Tax=Paenibacillus allorhizosphaerae TaxID=2849866 RepID=A0ABN7TIW1_9BACL|nr:nitroreductase [Paenibacillus allorhizosphaerae]CAG7634521.1 Putative NAD(P)H nitroreductase YdjA [Paenibacillus allorhizosphaerae]